MNTVEVEKILHQRAPYLMVDEVASLSENKIKTEKDFSNNEIILKGHFPGAPIVPGALQQELCTQSAAILMTKYYSPVKDYDSEKTKGFAIGILNKVLSAKYMDIVNLKSKVFCEVELIERVNDYFQFKAVVTQDNKVKAKLTFNLSISSDEILYQ